MKYLVYLLLFSVIACKNDNKVTNADLKSILDQNTPPLDPKDLKIPSACELITELEVETILKTNGSKVLLKEANDPESPNVKSCFFKWEDVNTPNAGILIQAQTNGIFGEMPEYISSYVNNKLKSGETVLGDETATKFTEFTVGGIRGAYSFQQSRFYWNLGNNYLFMLAFNVSTLSEEKMVDTAKELITIINNNFATKVK